MRLIGAPIRCWWPSLAGRVSCHKRLRSFQNCGGVMLWTPGGRSSNLEDRRSLGGGGVGRGLGIGGTVVVLALSLIFGRNLFNDLGVQPAVGAENTAPFTAADSAAQETEVQFISYVLDDVQNTWAK